MPARTKIRWRRYKNALDSRLPVEVQPEEAGKSDPEQHDAGRFQSLRFHLLAAHPKFGRGRRGDLDRCRAVVNRELGVQRKEKHQGAQPQESDAPERFIACEDSVQGSVTTPILLTIRWNPYFVTEFSRKALFPRNSCSVEKECNWQFYEWLTPST